MYDRSETYPGTIELLAEARRLRSEAMARTISSAWRGLSRLAARLLHATHLPPASPHAH
jgi:hypothetical protein